MVNFQPDNPGAWSTPFTLAQATFIRVVSPTPACTLVKTVQKFFGMHSLMMTISTSMFWKLILEMATMKLVDFTFGDIISKYLALVKQVSISFEKDYMMI